MAHDLLNTVAQKTMQWPFRLRAFGEGIALRGLLAAFERTGNREYLGYVHGLARVYLGSGAARSSEDHVSPALEFLQVYRHTGDASLLEACLRLAALHASFPDGHHHAKLHRFDQPGWQRQIWVDCMDVDAPFLTTLANTTGNTSFRAQGVRELLAYATLLQDERTGLFWHGYDVDSGRNGQEWARGNGWALLGLIETLLQLPADADGRDELQRILVRLARGLATHQGKAGLWHTLVLDESSYQETTLAAMVAYGFRLAINANLLDFATYKPVVECARSGVLQQVSADGELGFVSSATPVAETRTYATRRFGIYPWGQGPLLLMLSQEDL